MNKKNFYKDFYSDMKLSDNEKKIMLNNIKNQLSEKNNSVHRFEKLKPEFKIAVSAALSICIVTSALLYAHDPFYKEITIPNESESVITDVTTAPADETSENNLITENSSSLSHAEQSENTTACADTETYSDNNSITENIPTNSDNNETAASPDDIPDAPSDDSTQTEVTDTIPETFPDPTPDEPSDSEEIVPETTTQRPPVTEHTTTTNRPPVTECTTAECTTTTTPHTTTTRISTTNNIGTTTGDCTVPVSETNNTHNETTYITEVTEINETTAEESTTTTETTTPPITEIYSEPITTSPPYIHEEEYTY